MPLPNFYLPKNANVHIPQAINEKALLALSGRDGEEQKNLLRAICTKCSVVANAEAERTDLVDICSAVAELEEPEWVEEATLE